MKFSQLLLVFLCLCQTAILFAQPYHIDKSKNPPQQITLFEDPENEGVRLGSFEGELDENNQRFYIKGLIENNPVDLFIFSREEGNNLDIDLVKATWDDKVKNCNTGSKGYCHFKVATYGDVGVQLNGKDGSPFTILVVVGKEVRPELPSPFYKIDKKDLDKLGKMSVSGNNTNTEEGSTSGGGSNLIFYIIAFFLLLIVILLAVMVLRKGKSAGIIILLLASPGILIGQSSSDEDELNERVREQIKEEVKAEWERYKDASGKVDKFKGALKLIEDLRKAASDYKKFSESYEGLGDCFAKAPPYQKERIPSFCEGQEGCDACFEEARIKFNDARYYLGRLKTTYDCTIKMTDSAKAFGDSFSSATGTGLGWSSARKDIEASITKLQQAYDKKYASLMRDLHTAMIDMAICEAQYGLRDWYDRFGYVYYEFMADKYQRSK